MHLRALLLAAALFAGPVACSGVPVGAVDFSGTPVEGPVCASFEDLEAMYLFGLKSSDYYGLEAEIAAFNESEGRHCEVLYPTMVENAQRIGNYKTDQGIMLDIYSFQIAEKTFFIGVLSELTYA